MKVTTYEATVENGQIKLAEDVILPEHATVFIVVPGMGAPSGIRVGSPRLARPEQAVHFVKEMTEEPEDASLR